MRLFLAAAFVLLSFFLSFLSQEISDVAISFVPHQDRVQSSPGPRIGQALAYDERRARTVLFGGAAHDRVAKNDTWEWDGKRWRRVSAEGPSPRNWAALVYDAARGRVILFGGREGEGRSGTPRGETWEWDGKRWQLLDRDGPSPRDHHAMIYDRARKKIVLFGGWDGAKTLNDTWEWDGAKWNQLSQEGPQKRAAFGLAYDERRKAAVMFGGRDGDLLLDDTWTWDGRRWTRQNSSGPSKRAFPGMVYDSRQHRVILFGGVDKSGPNSETEFDLFNDTWAWNGDRWVKLSDEGPSERGVYSMAYDRSRRQAVFFGGGHRSADKWTLHNDTWAWNGSAWRKVD